MIIYDCNLCMSNVRYHELMMHPNLELTDEEIAHGWFWDNEMDGLLANINWPEYQDNTL